MINEFGSGSPTHASSGRKTSSSRKVLEMNSPIVVISEVITHYIETEQKYVDYINYGSVTHPDGTKSIEVAWFELEDSDVKTVDYPVESFPDLVVITPLKHEYAITFVQRVWE